MRAFGKKIVENARDKGIECFSINKNLNERIPLKGRGSTVANTNYNLD